MSTNYLVLFGHYRTFDHTKKYWKNFLLKSPLKFKIIFSTWDITTPIEKSWHNSDPDPERLDSSKIDLAFSEFKTEHQVIKIIERQQNRPVNLDSLQWRPQQMWHRVIAGLYAVTVDDEFENASLVILSRPDIQIFKPKKINKAMTFNVEKLRLCGRPLKTKCPRCSNAYTTWDLLWLIPVTEIKTLIANLEKIQKMNFLDFSCEHEILEAITKNVDYIWSNIYYGVDFQILRDFKYLSRKTQLLHKIRFRRDILVHRLIGFIKSDKR